MGTENNRELGTMGERTIGYYSRFDPRIWQCKPATKRTEKKRSEATAQNNPPRPIPTPPDPPIQISIPNMGPKM